MAIFQTCNLSSAVSACLFIDLQGQVRGAENCIVNRARACADAHFSGLGQLWAVCSSWNLVHGSSLLLLHLVRVSMLTSDSQCHDTAAMAGRRSRGRRREQVFFSLCRKATCLENYLCRPGVQKSNLFCHLNFECLPL